jgi:hypothetical protein
MTGNPSAGPRLSNPEGTLLITAACSGDVRHKGITLAFTRPYSSPGDLWNSLATQLDKKHTPALRNLEIRVALADYKCAETVALVSTAQAMQARHAR